MIFDLFLCVFYLNVNKGNSNERCLRVFTFVLQSVRNINIAIAECSGRILHHIFKDLLTLRLSTKL